VHRCDGTSPHHIQVGSHMALLIETGLSDWIGDEEIATTLQALAPGADIRTPGTLGDPNDITMLAVVSMQSNHPEGPGLRP
ncbi:hypothetical protein OU790_19110, partial [Ruegeria sp. NA]|nr:hypothetical protein [Ruegeria sp. NA]